MDDIETQERLANIAKLKAETESLKINVVVNIVKVALSAGALAIALVTAVKHLMNLSV